jgi:aldehyde dehydrogenase (NAD+)
MTERRILQTRNPRTGQFDHSFEATSAAHLATMARSLRQAQARWREIGVVKRVAALREFQRQIGQHEQTIGAALSTDTGRGTLARGEVGGLKRSLDRWCDAAPQLIPAVTAPSSLPGVDIEQTAHPYELVGVISPWNFPLLLSFIDAIPALLAGCAVLIKPSEVTPRFAAAAAQAVNDVPELRDVLSFCPGDGATGAALIPNVDAVAFTGSVRTGRKVLEAAAQQFIPAFLELGGKDAAVVLAGSDLDRACTSLLRASVIATGQACQSIERIYVNAAQHDAFVDKLSAKAAALPLSYPDIEQGIIGPLIFEQQAHIIEAQIHDAIAKGATVHTGGKIERLGGGLWIKPTVVSGVTHDMQLMTEETFGPIMPVMAFDHEDEAIRLANDSTYGLSGAVFGPTIGDAQRVARQLKAGGISVNDAGMTTMLFETEKSAFGLSGLGPSRVGPSGLTRFLRRQSIYLCTGDVMPIEAVTEGR